jgi:hypothetical protein
MKKGILICLTLLLVLSFAAFQKPAMVYAQGFGVSWASSFQVQNLGTADASILMYYYNQDGTLATMDTNTGTGTLYSNPDSDTVSLGASNSYYPIHAASGFNGSVVVSSSEPIAVISNVVIKTASSGYGSYVGFQQGASTIFFPIVMKGNGSNTTTFNVQNTGSTEAAITISFTPEPGKGYATISNIAATLPVGAAGTYNLNTLAEFSAVTKWVGSATVAVTDTANDSVAGVANTVNYSRGTAYQLGTYNAFTGGSTTVKMPLVMESNSGYRTSLNCQNIDTTTTTNISVVYTPETGGNAKSDGLVSNVGPNGVAVFLLAESGTAKFVGSATATSTPAVPLVCIVNETGSARGQTSSYEGFNPSTITDKVVLPLIQSKNSNWYTSINLATGDGASHAITCDFSPASGFTDPSNQSGTGASVVLLQNDIYGTSQKFVGGATCTVDSGAGLIAIVNQVNSTSQIADTLTSYDGFNVTP